MIVSALKDFRFCLVRPKTKEAFEPGPGAYPYGHQRLEKWMQDGGNYGVLAGPDHCIIDTDNLELARLVAEKLPATFTVHTPGHDGSHFYYNYTGITKTIAILDRTRPQGEQNIGHVKVGNGYALGPGSVHPNGELYLVSRDLPVADVSEEQIRGVLAPYLAGKVKAVQKPSGYKGDLDFAITRIVDTSKLQRRGNSYQGPHPIHGSTTGTNFHVNIDTGLWFCFRCTAGGGPLQLLAVQERIIECQDSGALRGEAFKKTVAIATERGLLHQSKKPKRDKAEKESVEFPWLPVTHAVPCLDEEALFHSLRDWVKRHVDFRIGSYYSVLTSWILASWLYETARVSGPAYFLGPINSGKTTALEVLEQLAYKCVRGGSMSNATMFRLSHALGPSFAIDEAQVYNKEEWAETQAFINERYRRGGKVWRMIGEGKKLKPAWFNAYGPTALASSNPPWPALASRALTFHMGKNVRDVEQTLTPEFESEGQEFRNLLQGFKDGRETKSPGVFPELKAVKDYRTREIGEPLLDVTPETERPIILGYLKELEGEHRAEEETGEEADYVAALNRCVPENGKVTAKEVRDKLAEVLGEVEYKVWHNAVGVEESKRVVNESAVPKNREILRVLVRLGFKKKARIGSQSLAGIVWDRVLLEHLVKRYGISPETPETPELLTLGSGDTEDTEDNQGS